MSETKFTERKIRRLGKTGKLPLDVIRRVVRESAARKSRTGETVAQSVPPERKAGARRKPAPVAID